MNNNENLTEAIEIVAQVADNLASILQETLRMQEALRQRITTLESEVADLRTWRRIH